jgi:hypothetical protein
MDRRAAVNGAGSGGGGEPGVRRLAYRKWAMGIDIKLGNGKVLGIDPQASGLVQVEVPLNPYPPDAWAQVFDQAPPGVSISLSMHPPRLYGDRVILRPPPEEVDKYMDALQQRVDATNAYYDVQVAPELERQRQRQEAEAAERQRKIDDAQRKLDERGDD